MAIEQIRFTTRVLGPAAAFRLEKRQLSQTLRSDSHPIIESILRGRVIPGDRLQVVLDSILLGEVELVSWDAVTWEALGVDDALRGGFDTLADLEQALKRAGYRFKPMNDYQFFRIQLRWLEEVYA